MPLALQIHLQLSLLSGDRHENVTARFTFLQSIGNQEWLLLPFFAVVSISVKVAGVDSFDQGRCTAFGSPGGDGRTAVTKQQKEEYGLFSPPLLPGALLTGALLPGALPPLTRHVPAAVLFPLTLTNNTNTNTTNNNNNNNNKAEYILVIFRTSPVQQGERKPANSCGFPLVRVRGFRKQLRKPARRRGNRKPQLFAGFRKQFGSAADPNL
jgi:hypothetical protein